MISQRPVIFGERETFDGLIAYTLDMENTFDIPRATTILTLTPGECVMAVSAKNPKVVDPLPMRRAIYALLTSLDTRPWWAVRLY